MYCCASSRKVLVGAMVRKSPSRQDIETKLDRPCSSDCKKGFRVTDHILAARFMNARHCSALLPPNVSPIASAHRPIPTPGIFSTVPSANWYRNAVSRSTISILSSMAAPVFKNRSRYTAGNVNKLGPVSKRCPSCSTIPSLPPQVGLCSKTVT